MNKVLLCFFYVSLGLVTNAQLPGASGSKILLPNGWSLSPAGKSLPLGDLPLNMAVSSSKKYIAVTNNGQSDQCLQLIDVTTQVVIDSMPIEKSWYGLQFSSNEKTLYASGGNNNCIYQYAVQNGKLNLLDSFVLGPKLPRLLSPAGLAVDDVNGRLYTVTKESDSLYVFATDSKKLIKSLPLGGEGYACILSPNKKFLYISCWGCDEIKLFDTKTLSFTAAITVGDNPNEICLSKNGIWLYVANSNDNSVSIINTKTQKVVEVVNAALYPSSP